MESKNKIAIVTGATRLQGIGSAVCRALAAEGIDILFTYWPLFDKQMPWGMEEDEPARLEKELRGAGVRCRKLEVDLAKAGADFMIMKETEEQLGAPSILVNNAAYSTNAAYDSLTAEDLDKHYQVNVRGNTLLSLAFAKSFNGGSGGRIINLTSGQSLGPMPEEIAYVATKGAIEAITVTLSQEIAHKGITVNAVNPGPTDSGWMDLETKQALEQQFPRKRVGKPEDVSRLIKFLAHEDAEWITGQVIHSEGGFFRS